MSLKCCIFDFDGTLFDSMFIWDQAGELYLRSQGKTPLPSTAEDLRTMSLRQAAQYFQTTYALPFPVEEIMEGINRTVEAFYFHDALPKPGVTALLEQLRQANYAHREADLWVRIGTLMEIRDDLQVTAHVLQRRAVGLL